MGECGPRLGMDPVTSSDLGPSPRFPDRLGLLAAELGFLSAVSILFLDLSTVRNTVGDGIMSAKSSSPALSNLNILPYLFQIYSSQGLAGNRPLSDRLP